MKKGFFMYDIFLQNNASKEIWLISGVTADVETEYYRVFDNFEMPEGVTSGEYTYAVIKNDRNDVTYTLNAVLLDSTAFVEEVGQLYTLEQLSPITGLLRAIMGEDGPAPVFPTEDTANNNTIYYYEG